MEDLEKTPMGAPFDDDIFDDIDIMSTDPDEPLWDKLTQQIIEGKDVPYFTDALCVAGQYIYVFEGYFTEEQLHRVWGN